MTLTLPADYDAMTFAERRMVRLEYVKLQGGHCWHCKAPLLDGPTKEITDKRINWRLFPKKFLRHPVHLHHNHRTGKTIGAVHALCNAVLWQYHGE